MLRAGLRVATGLVRSGDPQYRWRLVAILTGSALLTLSVLLAASVLTMVHRQDAREDARLPQVSHAAATTDVFARPAADRWRDRAISVVWIEPASPGARYAPGVGLAPGMHAMPAPGCSVVSTGLAQLIATEPVLAARYPCRSVLADDGVRDADELVAYSRPRDPRGLGDLEAALRYDGGRPQGSGPVVRYARLGLFADPDRITPGQLSIGLAAVALLPAIVVVVVSVSAASPLRERRLQLLGAIGAPPGMIRWITAFELLLLAVPSSLVVALAWCVATRVSVAAPWGILDGDLVLPAGVVGGLVVLSVVIAVALVLLAQRTGHQERPRSALAGLAPLSRLAAAPMALAAALFFASSIVGGARGTELKMLGALVAVAGTPLLIPLVARWLGGALGESRRPLVWLAGRALEWAPRRRARPFIGLGTLVAMLFLGVGYVSAVRHSESPPDLSYGRTSAVGVSWNAQAAPSLRDLTRGVPSSSAFAVSADEHDLVGDSHAGGQEPEEGGEAHELLLAATCPELAAAGVHVRCDPHDPYRLSTLESRALGSIVALTFNDEPSPIRLASPSELGQPVRRAVVLSATPVRQLDEMVRTSAQTLISAPTVSSAEDGRPVHTAVVGWIEGAFTAAAVLLSVAVLIAVIDRLLGSRRSWDHLMNLGLTRRRLARLDLLLLAEPWLAAVGTGVVVGSVVALAIGNPADGYPWGEVALVVGATAALTVVAAVAVFTLALRAVVPERE